MNLGVIGRQSDRERLAADCQYHAAPHLHQYVHKALSLLDIEVQNGRRTYAQVNVSNVLTVATKLFQHELASQVSAPKRARSPADEDETLRAPSRPAHSFENFVVRGSEQAQMSISVGRSTHMERDYSRDEPSMDDIRPYETLKKAFPVIVKRSLHLGNQYLYDQLKGMRQDLRVQNIRNGFAVTVYEAHARVCLDLKNLSEFNQCQSALRSFYGDGLVGVGGDAFEEFLCYRFLWLTLGDKDDLMAMELKEVERAIRCGSSPVDKRIALALKSESVLITLRFCACIQQGDSIRAVKIARHFDGGLLKLLRLFLQRQRIRWLRDLGASLRGHVPLTFLLTLIGLCPLPPKALDTLKRQPSERIRQQIVSELSDRSVTECEFLDGSFQNAESAWTELIKLLKIRLPPEFNFEQEVASMKDNLVASLGGTHTQVSAYVSCSADVAEIAKAVSEYCSFLTTRTDIASE